MDSQYHGNPHQKKMNFGGCAVPKFWQDAPMRARMCVLGEVTWELSVIVPDDGIGT